MSARPLLLGAIVALTLAACGAPVPPPPPAPRAATTVSAPVARTFDATIAILQEDGAKIGRQDRATGEIVTEELIIPFRYRGAASDCGEGSDAASNVVMTARVSGDEQRSGVQITGRFILRGVGRIFTCTTKDYWERNLEERIRERAEGR